MEAGSSAAAGAPATELYELQSTVKGLIPRDISVVGARERARALELARVNLREAEDKHLSVALAMHQFMNEVACARAELEVHGRSTDLTDDEYLLGFLTGHICSGPPGSLAAKGAPLLQALHTEATLRSPPISGEALREFARKICSALDASRPLDGQPRVLSPESSEEHQLLSVTMELPRLQAQQAETLKKPAESPAKAKAATRAAPVPAAAAPGASPVVFAQRAHGLGLSARRAAMKLGRCFYCGGDHTFSECTATVQRCPFCRESDHSGNDCPSLAEAKNV
jgi:hypothetical protein